MTPLNAPKNRRSFRIEKQRQTSILLNLYKNRKYDALYIIGFRDIIIRDLP